MEDDKNNFDSLKDLTDFVTIDGPAPGTADKPAAKGTAAAPALVPAEQGDHPGIALLDIAIEESVRYCEKEHFPPPNLSLWHNFSRGFLNKSLWHYFPTGAEPDSPAICALIGIAGLAVCYTPVIIAFYEAKQKEGKAAEKKKIAARTTAEPDPIKNDPEPEPPQEPEPEIPKPPAEKKPEWFMTTAQPVPAIARRIESSEPAAPGMG